MSRLFVTDREINFINSIQRELVQHVVVQEVKYYAILEDRTRAHSLYNEAVKKVWSPPVSINARVLWENPEEKSTNLGSDSTYRAEVYFHTRELQERNVEPKQGDFIEFGEVFFEIASVTRPDIIFGQVNNKTQVKCTCVQSRQGQFANGGDPVKDDVRTHQVNQNTVPPKFTASTGSFFR
ncbi:MAG TPA: hypothetical protein VFT74_16290 [Isosphaeraceae bacterium]|nr:hypothetical protein [Isosphaeraceae bacterium]